MPPITQSEIRDEKDDSLAVAYFEKVRRARERKAQGAASWWRRKGFAQTKKIAGKAQPKWHAYHSRDKGLLDSEGHIDPSVEGYATYTAACGYRYSFRESTLVVPLLRDQIKTQELRCAKCDRALAESQSNAPV